MSKESLVRPRIHSLNCELSLLLIKRKCGKFNIYHIIRYYISYDDIRESKRKREFVKVRAPAISTILLVGCHTNRFLVPNCTWSRIVATLRTEPPSRWGFPSWRNKSSASRPGIKRNVSFRGRLHCSHS